MKVLRGASEEIQLVDWKRFAREVFVWMDLKHPNILELSGFALMENKPCLISPLCKFGNVMDYLKENPAANRKRLVRALVFESVFSVL